MSPEAYLGGSGYEVKENTEYNIEAIKLAEGLGYGEGPISVDSRLGNENDPLDIKTLDSVHWSITDGEVICDVASRPNGEPLIDDGCIDGRGVSRVMEGAKVFEKSLNRPKVAGGGMVMAAASKIGLGEAKTLMSKIGGDRHVPTLGKLFKKARRDMKHAGLGFGGHCGSHQGSGNCDCGAIDKAPLIVDNAVNYHNEIAESIFVLSGSPEGQEKEELLKDINAVYREYRNYSKQLHRKDYSGARVLEDILDDGGVVKELKDDHREVAIVINEIENKTTNQAIIREKTDDVAQVFAIDAWRMRQIADKLHPDNEKDSKKSYISMLVYSLSTAATLTAGDLPVYIVKAK